MKDKRQKQEMIQRKVISAYVIIYNDDEHKKFYYKHGKDEENGKKHGRRSSGKGRGRRTNPRNTDGKIMKRYWKKPNDEKCNSTEHLARDCPYNNGESRNSSSDTTQGANVHYSTQVQAYQKQDTLLPLLEQSE